MNCSRKFANSKLVHPKVLIADYFMGSYEESSEPLYQSRLPLADTSYAGNIV
jgi:hypothetical protein